MFEVGRNRHKRPQTDPTVRLTFPGVRRHQNSQFRALFCVPYRCAQITSSRLAVAPVTMPLMSEHKGVGALVRP